jgi:hypothetical protein
LPNISPVCSRDGLRADALPLDSRRRVRVAALRLIALFTVPALSRWRRLGWALLIALAVLFLAALIWTWLA